MVTAGERDCQLQVSPGRTGRVRGCEGNVGPVERVTDTAWFGPKRWGWGWSPASWQGWAVTLAFGVLGQLVKRLSPRRRIVATLLLVAGFFGVIVLTGDPPGSRRLPSSD